MLCKQQQQNGVMTGEEGAQDGNEPVGCSSNVAVKNALNTKCCASSSDRMAQNIVNVTAATLQWSRAR